MPWKQVATMLATIKHQTFFTTSCSAQLLRQLRMHQCLAPVSKGIQRLIYEHIVKDFLHSFQWKSDCYWSACNLGVVVPHRQNVPVRSAEALGQQWAHRGRRSNLIPVTACKNHSLQASGMCSICPFLPSGTAVLPLQTHTKSYQNIAAAAAGLLHLRDGARMRWCLCARARFFPFLHQKYGWLNPTRRRLVPAVLDSLKTKQQHNSKGSWESWRASCETGSVDIRVTGW